jgi:hypothetical protein
VPCSSSLESTVCAYARARGLGEAGALRASGLPGVDGREDVRWRERAGTLKDGSSESESAPIDVTRESAVGRRMVKETFEVAAAEVVAVVVKKAEQPDKVSR